MTCYPFLFISSDPLLLWLASSALFSCFQLYPTICSWTLAGYLLVLDNRELYGERRRDDVWPRSPVRLEWGHCIEELSPGELDFSLCSLVSVFCSWHIFHFCASVLQGRLCLTPCLSHGLYPSWVQTHKALAGPGLRATSPYIYPTLLFRVTNMDTDRRGVGVTQLSAHCVEWSLHSDDCVCDCCPNKYLPLHLSPEPGMAECQKMTHPTHSAALSESSFFIAHPSQPTPHSLTLWSQIQLNLLPPVSSIFPLHWVYL